MGLGSDLGAAGAAVPGSSTLPPGHDASHPHATWAPERVRAATAAGRGTVFVQLPADERGWCGGRHYLFE